MNRTYYELTPSQKAIEMLLTFSLHSQTASVPLYVVVERKLNIDLLKKAFDIEAERNDSFRLRFHKGLKGFKQYFTEEAVKLSEKIETADFTGKTEKDEIDYLKKDASKKLKYRSGETVRIILYRSYDGGTGIYVNAFHIAFDASAIMIMLNDVLDVYDSLENGKELPPPLYPYEEKIKSENLYVGTEQYKRKYAIMEKTFREGGTPFFASPAGIAKLKAVREKKKDPNINTYPLYNPFLDKCETLLLPVSGDAFSKMSEYCSEKGAMWVPLLHAGYRIYCSAVNERNPSVMVQTVCDRRSTKNDKRTGGSLALGNNYHFVVSETDTFAELVDKTSVGILNEFRYVDINLSDRSKLMKELYNVQNAEFCAYNFSYLVAPGVTKAGDTYRCGGVDTGYFGSYFYMLVVHNMGKKSIDVNYMYKPSFIEDRNVRELHENALRVIEAGIENPDVTVGELLDMVESEHINK